MQERSEWVQQVKRRTNAVTFFYLSVLEGRGLGEEEVLILAEFWTGIELIRVCLPKHGHSRIVRVVRNWNWLPRGCLPGGIHGQDEWGCE